MNISRVSGLLKLQTKQYRLTFHEQRPFVDVEKADGERLLELFVFSSVHPLQGRDDTYKTSEWAVHETDHQFTVSISAKSTVWDTKTYTFHCTPDRFTYTITVEGQGQLAELLYFGGFYSESLRWSSGFFWSGQYFEQLFNPEPNIPETFHVPPGSGSKIDMTGVPIPAKGDWFFTPPPFCFAGKYDDGWLSFGVECRPGENTFTEYGYHGNLEAFHLSLNYEGHTTVNGAYQLPALAFDFAPDEYAAIEAHVSALRQQRFVATRQNRKKPAWWYSPIFCGWGPQCYLAAVEKGRAPDYARQEHYEKFLQTLDAQQIDPGVIVLDDKWQATYGDNTVDVEKWHDVSGFIAHQHARGRKVLLWLKAWDCEGVPPNECITNAGGQPIAFDPTNPAYELRLRASVRRMLSADGYNADGFKIDFTARIPSGYGLNLYDENVWGLELMRKYLSILHTEAKQVKPDALIMAHTPHPYLADTLDMIRLNDINIGRDINRAMRHRAKVARIACPDAIIDTDNWPITDKAAWRDYLQIQPELGVPSLYCVTHIDSTLEPLDSTDYQLIRDVWARYRRQVPD